MRSDREREREGCREIEVCVYIYIYICIWLGPGHLPTFFGSKPIYHLRLAQKKAFFFTQMRAKNNTVFQPHDILEKRLLSPVSQRFFRSKRAKTPCFIVFWLKI